MEGHLRQPRNDTCISLQTGEIFNASVFTSEHDITLTLSKSPEYLSCIIIARIQPPDSSLPGSPLHHYQQMNLNTTTKLNSRATLS